MKIIHQQLLTGQTFSIKRLFILILNYILVLVIVHYDE